MKTKRSRFTAVKFQKAVAVLAAVLVFAGTSFAGDMDKLINMLSDKGVITSSEAQQLIAGQTDNVPAWVKNMKLSGDMRLRYQSDWADHGFTRDRMRLRLRFGVETNPIENMTAAFGLATGSMATPAGGGTVTDSNPATRNYTFEDFTKPTIMVDFAYVQYKIIDGIKISGGKVKNDMAVWNLRQLVWDGNINPDGFAANVNKKIDSSFDFFANAGWYTMGEGNTTAGVSYLMPDVYIAQPGISYKSDLIAAKVAIAYQQFNTKGRMIGNNLSLYFKPIINTVNYNIIDPSAEVKFKNLVGKYGVSVFGEYVKNINGDVKNNAEGGLYGIGVGNDGVSKFGEWNLAVMGRYLMSNSVPNGLSFSDVYGGYIDNGIRGYEINFNFGLVKNASAAINYLNYKNINGVQIDKSLIQLDLNYKF